jgi:LuxR family transcriptional regulator, maltose regulon positive regulatory protein
MDDADEEPDSGSASGRKVVPMIRPSAKSRSTASGARPLADPPLLPTKLFVPMLETAGIERVRLLQAISAPGPARLLLVSAPAGSGKTTLVAQWVRQAKMPAGWLSLDAGDDDPATFLGYLVEALQSARPGCCQRAQALLRSGAAPEPRVVAMHLLAELAVGTGDSVLVLDDYHVITDPAVHDLVAHLIERTPPSIRFVVVTRHDPSLPLPRLRARGLLRELRAADLRFDDDEARALTERLAGKPLRPESMAVLTARTEGWAAGLQLAALALRQSHDPDAMVAGFSGAHAFVADYLADEVLAGMPEEQHRFLIETAPLARLTGSLCDAALQRTGSQGLLDDLHRGNLFLVPLDSDRRWYRYHHLFADLLRRRGGEAAAASRRGLLARAAAWCEAHGAVDDAVQYLMQANEPSLAADLVARHGIAKLAAGAGITVLRWIRQLPDAVVRSSPDHCVIAAWALTLMQVYDPDGGVEDVAVERKAGALGTTRHHDPIGGYAQQALALLAEGSRPFPAVDDVAHHARVLLATADSGPDDALRALEHARDDIPAGNLPLRAVTEVRIGELGALTGRYDHALAALDRARDLAEQAGSALLRVSAVTGRALVLWLQGRIGDVIATVEAELDGHRSQVESLGTYAGNLCALLAAARLERDELDACQRALTRTWMAFGADDGPDAWRGVVRFGQDRPRAAHLTVQAVLWGFTTQVGLLVRRGEVAAARRHLDALAATMPRAASATERVVLEAARVQVWAAAGDRARLTRWWRHEVAGVTGLACWDQTRALARAQAAEAAGDQMAARAALAEVLDTRGTTEPNTAEPGLARLAALILDGVLLAGGGDRTAGRRRAVEALRISRAEGRVARG